MSDKEAELMAAAADREEALSDDADSAAAEGDKRQSGSKSVAIWRTGWEVVKETFEGVDQLEIPLRAAAVAYYGLLAIFPLLLFFISLGSVLLSRSEVREALNEFAASCFPDLKCGRRSTNSSFERSQLHPPSHSSSRPSATLWLEEERSVYSVSWCFCGRLHRFLPTWR
jgi:hypothetical protein